MSLKPLYCKFIVLTHLMGLSRYDLLINEINQAILVSLARVSP